MYSRTSGWGRIRKLSAFRPSITKSVSNAGSIIPSVDAAATDVLSPAVMAVRMPGLGHPLQEIFAEFPSMAVWDAICSTHLSLGTVRASRNGLTPRLTWNLHPDDVRILARSLFVLSEIFFAAGATRIVPGVNGLPEIMHSMDDAELFRTHPIKASDLVSGGNHAFCTTRMHGDSAQGVVDGTDDMRPGEAFAVRPFPHSTANLGGQDNVLAVSACRHPAADDLLGDAPRIAIHPA